jgi:hypothetical protein
VSYEINNVDKKEHVSGKESERKCDLKKQENIEMCKSISKR